MFGGREAPLKQAHEAIINGIHFAANVLKLNV
jgi:hypothetical protein